MLAGKASDTLLAGGTMNNLGGEDSDTIVENGSIYRLGTDGLQLYSSGKTQNLSVNVGGRAEVHAYAGKRGNTRWDSDPVVTHQRGRKFCRRGRSRTGLN